MKISTDKIKKMARSVIRGEKHYGEHLMMSPVRDWYLGLAVFVIVGGAGAGWAGVTFLQHKNNVEHEITRSVEVEVYKKSTVAAALKDLDERKVQYQIIESRLTASGGHSKPAEPVINAVEEASGSSVVPEVSASSSDGLVPEPGGGAEPAL